MPGVLVILPAGVDPPPLPEDAVVRTCTTAGEVADALSDAAGDVVLCCEGFPDLELIAGAVRTAEANVVLVEPGAWDGESHSPVSAACSGVIAGFGLGGVSAAVALLRERA